MSNQWKASAIDQGDTRYRVSRAYINANGKYTMEKHSRTFASLEAAEKVVKQLNSVDQ